MPKLFIDDQDIAMRYEKLIVGVYGKYKKYGDPLKNAAQDYYAPFVDEKNLKSFHSNKVTLGIVIGVISGKYPEGDHIKELIEVEANLKKADNQEQIIEVIDDLINLYNQI